MDCNLQTNTICFVLDPLTIDDNLDDTLRSKIQVF